MVLSAKGFTPTLYKKNFFLNMTCTVINFFEIRAIQGNFNMVMLTCNNPYQSLPVMTLLIITY